MNFDDGLLGACLPPDLLTAAAKDQVVDRLAALPVDCVIRTQAALAWERRVGARLTVYEMHMVINGLERVDRASS